MERSRLDLFLEKVLECLAGIVGTRNAFDGNRGSCNGSRWRGILFDRRAKFVERAIVPLVLARNALRNRLHAFESRSRVKISALLAAVQFESAPRALAFRVETRLQHGAAIRTSCARDRTDHARRARSDLVLSRVAFGRPFLFFLGLVGTHVAPLLILPLQGNLRGGDLHHTLNRPAQHKKQGKL